MDKYWKNVQKADGCWPWTGSYGKANRGQFYYAAGKRVGAPRYAWFMEHGIMPPKDKMVLHSCDNPNCVNPDHLRIGTAKDNMQDKIKSGNNHELNKTHCPSGHPYNDANTLRYRGQRACRACARAKYHRDKALGD
jgi:hypothetical protein